MRAPLSNHGHFLSTVEDCRPLYLPVIDLAPRGEGGMVASAEEAESSASSASSDRPSAVLPIVSPPRGLLAWVSWKENLLSKFSVLFIYTPVWPWPVIRISNSNILGYPTGYTTASTTPPINGKRCGVCPSTSKRCPWSFCPILSRLTFRPHHADDPRQNDAAWVDFAGPRQGADGRCSTPGAEDPVNATQARGAHPLEPGPG